jgi:hypothetical protein
MNYEIPKQTSVVRDTNGAGATGFVATNQGGHGYRMDRNTFEKHGNRETSMMAKKYFLKKICRACAMAKRATSTKRSVGCGSRVVCFLT